MSFFCKINIFIDFKPFRMVFRLRKISRWILKVGLTFFFVFDFREKFAYEELLMSFFSKINIFIDFKPFCMVFRLRKISRWILKVGLTFFFVFDFREKFAYEELLMSFFSKINIFIDFKPFCMVFRLRKISRWISKVGLTFFFVFDFRE